jgi:uncharacterized protein
MQHTTLLLLATITFMLIAFNASAISLDAARGQGLVGETQAGYIAAVQPGTPEIERLIAEVNAKRRSRYRQIAQKNGLSLSAVEQQAGGKLTTQVPPGQYIKRNQRWQKK